MTTMKIIGTSRVLPQNKITLKKDVVEKLGVSIGEHVAFVENEPDEMIIVKLEKVAIR